MNLEAKLSGWTGPSSATEQDKQERTERMVREAIAAHSAFSGCSFRTYAKGSYPNNTNVRADSDVDVAVQCSEVVYWGAHTPGAHPRGPSYDGPWTPMKVRSEVTAALRAKFGDQVDTSGNTAIRVRSSTARVEADVVPCFDYLYIGWFRRFLSSASSTTARTRCSPTRPGPSGSGRYFTTSGTPPRAKSSHQMDDGSR